MTTQTTTRKPDAAHMIYDYLLAHGVKPFWADRALEYIQAAMNGNRHFCTRPRQPRVRVNPLGYVERFAMTVDVILPDADRREDGQHLVYTFNPDRPIAHKAHFES